MHMKINETSKFPATDWISLISFGFIAGFIVCIGIAIIVAVFLDVQMIRNRRK
jgi:hypothetical protein